MKRKFIGNLFLALVVPFLLMLQHLPAIYVGLVYGKYKYYDFEITSLSEYLSRLFDLTFFVISYVLSLVFILLPFQLIKNRYYRKRGKPLVLWKKMLILIGIVTFAMALGNRAPIYSALGIFLGYGLGLGIPLAWLAERFIDRYVEMVQNDIDYN